MRSQFPKDEGRDPKANDLWGNLMTKLGYKKAPMVKTASAGGGPRLLSDSIQVHSGANLQRSTNRVAYDAAVTRVADQAQESDDQLQKLTAAIKNQAEAISKGLIVGALDGYFEVKSELGLAQNLAMEAVAAGADLMKESEIMVQAGLDLETVAAHPAAAIPSAYHALRQTASALRQFQAFAKQAAARPHDHMAKARCAQYVGMIPTFVSFMSAEAQVGSVGLLFRQSSPKPQARAAGPVLRGTMDKFGATGDPGDMQPGNTIYKDINTCRDCTWFESDWTHETYRDKCRDCCRAKLGGEADHFWPKAAQIVTWCATPYMNPSLPAKTDKKASFVGSLGLGQALSGDLGSSRQETVIATEVVARAKYKNAVSLGESLFKLLQDLPQNTANIVAGIASEVQRLAGVQIAFDLDQAVDWGWKVDKTASGFKSDGFGEKLIIAFPTEASIEHEAKGERQKIKSLRERLDKTDDPSEIKSLSDAIDALETRRDKDKEKKEQRKKEREDKAKAAQPPAADEPKAEPKEAPKAPAPAETAPRAQAKTAELSDSLGYCDSCDSIKSKCVCKKAGHDPKSGPCDRCRKPATTWSRREDGAGVIQKVAECASCSQLDDDEWNTPPAKKASFVGSLSLAGAREREDKKPMDYGNAKPPKPLKALAAGPRMPGEVYTNAQGLQVKVMDDHSGQIMASTDPNFQMGETVNLDQDFDQNFKKSLPQPMASFRGCLSLRQAERGSL